MAKETKRDAGKRFIDAEKKKAAAIFAIEDFQLMGGLSTGYPHIDYAGGNEMNILFPFGLITEIYGEESSGKSTLVAEAVAHALHTNPDGYVVYLDFENSLFRQVKYMLNLGLDINPETNPRFLYFQPADFQSGGKLAEFYVKDKNCLAIVFDTVASMRPKQEKENEFGETKQKGLRGLLMAELCRNLQADLTTEGPAVILINQRLMKLDISKGTPGVSMFTPANDHRKWQAPADGSTRFYVVVRYETTKSSEVKEERTNALLGTSYKAVIGHKTNIKNIKNKVGTPKIVTQAWFMNDMGVDIIPTLFDVADAFGVWTATGGGSYKVMLNVKGIDKEVSLPGRGKDIVMDELRANKKMALVLAKAIDQHQDIDIWYPCVKEKWEKYARASEEWDEETVEEVSSKIAPVDIPEEVQEEIDSEESEIAEEL